MQTNDLIEYLKFMFEHVKLQQEVRDRWFRYYLIITGVISAAGITAIQLFYVDGSFNKFLFSLLLLLSIAMFCIGSCFFMIYLKQRLNYLKQYKIIEILENKLPFFEDIQSISDRRVKKYGADFYTIWIHILINSFYGAVVFLLTILLIKQTQALSSFHIILSIIVFFILAICFEIIRRNNE